MIVLDKNTIIIKDADYYLQTQPITILLAMKLRVYSLGYGKGSLLVIDPPNDWITRKVLEAKESHLSPPNIMDLDESEISSFSESRWNNEESKNNGDCAFNEAFKRSIESINSLDISFEAKLNLLLDYIDLREKGYRSKLLDIFYLTSTKYLPILDLEQVKQTEQGENNE